MIKITSDILTLTNEPAVLAKHSRIVFANRSAEDILGKDCVGKSILTLFGQDVAGTQASSFVADIPVNDVHYVVRVSHGKELSAIFFSHYDDSPVLMNDAFICSMRNGLMNIGISSDIGRLRAEELGDRELAASFASLTKNYYSVSRLLSNASVAKGIFANDLPVALSSLDISEQYQNIISTVSSLRPDINFSVNIDDGIIINADASLLELLLLNLLSNCLLHAEGLSRISVSLIDGEENLVISVSDNGHGIKPEEMHSVFSRYRHSFDISKLGSGTGLGLTVVRGIAEYHGGTLLMESRRDRGTTVRASISKKLGSSAFHEPQSSYAGGMKSILTGLADCLPEDCFTEKYMD